MMKIIRTAVIFLLCVLLLSASACWPFALEPTPTPTPIIQAVDVTVVPREFGGFYFMGFVQNAGTSPGECREVSVRVYDSAGTLLAQGDDPLFLYLRPDERFPFCISPQPQPLTSWERYELTVDTAPWGWVPTLELHPEVQVASHQWDAGDLTGTFMNTGQESAEAMIHAVGYNSEGDIIAVGRSTPGVVVVPPDVPTFFRVDLWWGDESKVASYDLFIKSRFLD